VQKEAFIKDGEHECCEIVHHGNTVYTLDQTFFLILHTFLLVLPELPLCFVMAWASF